jgi:hypothetical protein
MTDKHVKVIKSFDEIGDDMRRLQTEMPNEIANGIVDFIELVIGPETAMEVPVETTNLANSWTVEDPVISAGRTAVSFGYGTNYAVWVHEIPPPESGAMVPKMLLPSKAKGSKVLMALGLLSKLKGTRTARHKPPTKWKYLEDPVNRHIDGLPRYILDRTDMVLEVG